MTSPTILSAPHISQKYKPNPKKKAGEGGALVTFSKCIDIPKSERMCYSARY
jgi:hypothetical protein